MQKYKLSFKHAIPKTRYKGGANGCYRAPLHVVEIYLSSSYKQCIRFFFLLLHYLFRCYQHAMLPIYIR